MAAVSTSMDVHQVVADHSVVGSVRIDDAARSEVAVPCKSSVASGKSRSFGFLASNNVTGGRPQFGRWIAVFALTTLSILVIFADTLAFGREGGGRWPEIFAGASNGMGTIEIVLFAAIAIQALRKWAWPDVRERPEFSSKATGGSTAGGRAADVRNCVTAPAKSVPAKKTGRKFGEATARTGCGPSEGANSPGIMPGTAQSTQRKSANTVVAKYNQAIDAAARQGDVVKAGTLLLELERSGGQPEAVTYNLVIRACAKRGDSTAAEKWFRRMEARGVQCTVCSYNTLLDACAKADDPWACESWLQHMQSKGIEANVISYATTIYAHARRGDVDAADTWLKRMIDAGIQPDCVTYNSLLHACGVRGDVHRAELILQEMTERGMQASVTTYTAIIDACAKAIDVERAGHWFDKLLGSGLEANLVTYVAMIDACAKAGNLPKAEYWHDRMTNSGIAPTAHSFSAVINACAKSKGSAGGEAAEQWLDRSEKAGVVNDIVIYGSVIDACGKAGDAERALRVFRRMRSSGLKPHIVAYAALARPFAYRGDWVKVESIAQNMAADGLVLNEYFLYAQLLAYAVARPRQVQRAEECFQSAIAQGVQANDHVVNVLARAVGRPRCTELVNKLCGREMPPPRWGQDSRNRAGNLARDEHVSGRGNAGSHSHR